MARLKQYLLNILISIDQLGNTIFGGSPDMTISERLGKYYRNSELRKFVDLLFGKRHCENVAEKGDSGKAILK